MDAVDRGLQPIDIGATNGLIEQLTELKIRAIATPGLYPDGRGLYLQVRINAAQFSRSWVYRFTLNRRTRDKGLGALADVGLVEARAKAAECRALVAKGIDPIEHAKSERAAANVVIAKSGPTFREVAEAYMDEKLPRLRSPVHRRQWRYTLEKYTYPIIGDVLVRDVDTAGILKCLRPIWADKCETASRLRGRIERILARATVEGLRTGDNPAHWRGHLMEALAMRSEVQPKRHFAAMKFEDVPVLVAELDKRSGVAAVALQYLILTAARTGEVMGARWDEIDFGAKLWTIPAERMKMKREHVVPLSTGSLTLLRQMLPLRDIGNGFIFPGVKGRGLGQMTMLMLLQRQMRRNDATVHGFRSAFRDWAGDVADVPREIAEAALAHVLKDATERAYRRGTAIERRREVMQAWSDYCSPPAAPDAVVDLQVARQLRTSAA